jgi:hypothetical protein
MRLQVPQSVDTEVSQEETVLGIATRARASTVRTGHTQRKRDAGKAIAARPCALLISIPPKYAVSQVVGYIEGKSAIHIARNYMGRRGNFTENTSGTEATMYQRLA